MGGERLRVWLPVCSSHTQLCRLWGVHLPSPVLRHLRKREPPDCVSRTDAQQRGSGWAVRPITPLETRAGGVGLFGRGRKHLRTQKTARRCDAGTDICGTDKVRCGRLHSQNETQIKKTHYKSSNYESERNHQVSAQLPKVAARG